MTGPAGRPMPNQRRADWTSRGVAMPDELWRALQARVTEQLPSVGAVIRAACERYVKETEQ